MRFCWFIEKQRNEVNLNPLFTHVCESHGCISQLKGLGYSISKCILIFTAQSHRFKQIEMPWTSKNTGLKWSFQKLYFDLSCALSVTSDKKPFPEALIVIYLLLLLVMAPYWIGSHFWYFHPKQWWPYFESTF